MPSFQSMILRGKDCCHTSGLCVRLIASVPDGIRWLGLHHYHALDVLVPLRACPTTVWPVSPSCHDCLRNQWKFFSLNSFSMRHYQAVQPIFDDIDSSAAHCDSYSFCCSCTNRTARSRTSGEYLTCFFITLSSQEIESPVNPGRFTTRLFVVCVSIKENCHITQYRVVAFAQTHWQRRGWEDFPDECQSAW
jgi:hypothetical protein